MVKYMYNILMVNKMEKRYINEERYRKTARTKNRRRSIVKSTRNINSKNVQKNKKSNKKKYKVKTGKLVRFIFCLLILLVIAVFARVITRKENDPFIPVFFNNDIEENTQTVNIAVYTNANIGANNSIVTELEQYIYPMLLKINSNYEIKYEVVSSVNKINNKEYEIILDSGSDINSVEVKDTIDKIIAEKNKYYYKVENVDKVEIKSETELKITLKNEDEYFIYNLNIPIYKEVECYGIYKIKNNSNDKLELSRKESVNKQYIKNINIIKINSEEEATQKYKEGAIDVYFCSSTNSLKMLGKYEYDVKSYNNGEGIFLMFNPNSVMTREKYIRQIIAYSINREEIVSQVGNGTAEIIDLPYIYDDEKYKYDVYAAENIIRSNCYEKQGLYYMKHGKKFTLELIVNKDDEERNNIANKIKNDLLKVGIDVNIHKLSESDIRSKVSTGNYDILLASVYMNENPNINHVLNNIVVTENIANQMDTIKSDKLENLAGNLEKLKTCISDEIGIYGIYSKQTYVIYKKGLDIFKNINYVNLFGEYFNTEVNKNGV